MNQPAIAPLLLAWWDTGHADLPWRRTRDPYAIWISEVMLQQTQIKTVIPYYERWMAQFPTVADLAAAPLENVLKAWEGLGYYSRARNLHAAAQQVVEQFGGRLPHSAEMLRTLKGIGPYTAGAIASIAFDAHEPVVDGNVMRVLTRLFDNADNIAEKQTQKWLWRVSAELLPTTRCGDYNQALMELGQQICTTANPTCHYCPLNAQCVARAQGTQLERPVRPPRKKTPHHAVVAAVIRNSDAQLLMLQRPLNGLLGGLWEFPNYMLPVGSSPEQTLAEEATRQLNVQLAELQPLTTVKHAYTHFRITMHAYTAMANNGGVPNDVVHQWVDLSQIEQLPLPVTAQKIVKSLAQG